MSFDLPASLEREIEQYAQTEHISPKEAAVQLLSEILQVKKRKTPKAKVTEADLETLRQNVPFFAFMEKLPEDVVQGMQSASKQFRAEKFIPRG
jgi:hypothetical protein